MCVGQCCRVCSGLCVLGSVAGCVQGFGVLFLAMSGTSQLCVLGSVVGCGEGFGVLFLAMSDT